MKIVFIISFLLVSITKISLAQYKTIHVFVSLCDNKYQGIVKVPSILGNGKDAKNNLYWGAAYGLKSFFKNKTSDWKLISKQKSNNPYILEQLLFKHTKKEVYILADAYDGEQIKKCTEHFLQTANNQLPITIRQDSLELQFGGNSDLVVYIGHNGLMDFNVNISYDNSTNKTIDVMIFACYSKRYFSADIQKAKAKPVLWTTHLIAPEAYILKSAIDGWILKENEYLIKERVAQSYNKYQKCGLRGARNLFTTGF